MSLTICRFRLTCQIEALLCCCPHHFSAQWCLHSSFISSSRSLSHVSLSGSPLWSPGAAIIVPPHPQTALNISLILFPSHTLPLCLKTPFLDANWQRRARTSFSYVILRKKKKKRHDNANSQRQRFSRSTNARHAPKWSLLLSTQQLRGGRAGHTEGRREQTLPLITSVLNQRQWAT